MDVLPPVYVRVFLVHDSKAREDEFDNRLWEQEADQTAFDFIIKYPAESLRRALRRSGVETLINDFLDTLFNLGTDLTAEDLRQTSPLIYEHHEAILQDQTITEVKVGFLARSILPIFFIESLLELRIHTVVLVPPPENNFALGWSYTSYILMRPSGKILGAAPAATGCRCWIHSYC